MIQSAVVAPNDHGLYYISEGWRRRDPSVFYSLDFDTSWPVSAPAWTELTHHDAVRTYYGKSKPTGVSKDGSLLYLFDNLGSVRVYNAVKAEW